MLQSLGNDTTGWSAFQCNTAFSTAALGLFGKKLTMDEAAMR